MTSRAAPNVLLIMVDQLAAAWLPAYGQPVVQAPNITALARAGVTFEAAYCGSPLCAPSRSALLTGRLPSATEVYDNAAELRASLPTVAHHLRAEGYATCLAGKMHFVGPDQLHGFEERVTTDVYPAGLDWTPDWRVGAGERLPWYHTMESVLRPGVSVASMQVDYDDEVAFHAVRTLYDLARGGADPFFLTVSFSSPHDPWEIPARHWDRYDPAAIPLPAVPPIPFDEADPHSRRLRAMYGVDDAQLTEEQVRRARHGYFAAISYVDERIGDVLGALREAGHEDDTIVVFTADHGEMLGERGLWYKMAFFEEAARVPLIVRAPGRLAAGRRIASPVSQLDLAPTLVELCAGAAVDVDATCAGMDGTSLAPLLREDGERPGDVVAEYLAEGVTAPAVMVRRGPMKYIACPGDPEQLYDLAADPRELHDLAAQDGATSRCAPFREAVAARWDLADIEARVLESQRLRRQVVRALGRGRHAAWDFQPHVDASMQYVRSRTDLYDLQRRARLDARAPEGGGCAEGHPAGDRTERP
ncbi:MAG: choline-sulfatase [Solirubrobacteraceae bacterium]|nr:choline-sulfatase [Solirubrobacteraceae bacterium]